MAVVVSGALVPAVLLVLAWLMPSLTPPDLPFGVRIPAARRNEPAIVGQLRPYRRWLVGWGAVVPVAGCVLAGFFPDGAGAEVVGTVPAFVVLAVYVTGYTRARRAVLAAKQAGGWYEGLRQGVAADTSLRTSRQPFPWLWALPSVLLTAATAAIGAARYDDMPQRLPMYFGFDGTAVGFADKSVGVAFVPVFGQVALTALITATVWAVLRGRADLDPARPVASAAGHRRYVARMGAALLVLAAALDLSMLLAALRIWDGAGEIPPVLPLAPVAFGLAVLVVAAARTAQDSGPAAADGPDESTVEPDSGLVHADDDRHWRAGIVYVNRQDPALLVRKRFGIGWTVNAGNPRAVLLLLTSVALVVALTVAWRAPEHTTIAATDRDVTFTVDGTLTYGTVHVPAHRAGQRLAAALLLPGSGTTDRDGNQPPAMVVDTLALTANALDADGVMSLRFDKYDSGRTGPGAYRDDPGRIDMAAFTRQAEAAYAVMRDQPESDPRALLIIGHSEGALHALLAAHDVSPAPAGLALLAPQDQRLLDLISRQLGDQLDQLAAAGRVDAATAASNKAGITRAVADFRAERAADTSGLLPPFADLLNGLFSPYNSRFVRTDDATDPLQAARGIPPGTRVEVTCGTADSNVPCDTLPPFTAALRETGTASLVERRLDGVDHLLRPAAAPPQTKVLDPSVLDALHQFDQPWRRRA
ncbi:DUF5808 domain-containing protein [Yinghuangia seranimata]|uniref:DUF5808 domain-containing protein n=1 Tax=Yinghuangia seranimata TaxID=408067 RepID=UPI00248CB6F9|nr:DUF5808 domain-containing protein [Yinghuangia seranimata]MDI2129109.1 DUF5808 domain-containing protein [Yinghuangia seranimata]